MARSTARRTGRLFILGACTLAVAVLIAAIVRQSWQANAAAANIVSLEAQGAEMLHETTTLIGELVAAQSAAVRGERVDTEAVRKALAEVADVDERYGVALQTRQRLASLTSDVESAFRANERGPAAYDTYSGLVQLAMELERRIGDTSHLIHDPDLDSYYLMDAAIVRLPTAIVLAGRASDLVALADERTLSGEAAMSAAVARFGVSDAAKQVIDGLNKSVSFTARSDLGSNIAERLDAFRAAVDAFAPPTMLNLLAGPVDAAALASNARKVYATANPLTHRLLGELQELLDERAAKLAGDRRFTAISAGIVALLGLAMLWLLALGRRRPGGEDGPSEPRRADDAALGSLAYARELLDAEELVHIGRAVRTQRREQDDAE